jgi:hypothetical protein
MGRMTHLKRRASAEICGRSESTMAATTGRAAFLGKELRVESESWSLYFERDAVQRSAL